VNFLSIIEAKRNGDALTTEQVREFVSAAARGTVPDYQLAALLMAAFLRGMTPEETSTLTLAMRDSGEVLKFPDDPRPVLDKHSTGGIGDKVSLPLAPLLACLGFRVPMISGRGLGITGGTLDKLESIPGYRTRLDAAEMTALVQRVGCVICGQSDAMCPADRKLYALRDVTATVPSIPLITASILSKKLAEGIGALVLDVKFGRAAFMQTRDEARALAASMARIAGAAGVRTRALLTDMNTPLGRTAGNWLEVKESIDCLDGRGPADLREITLALAAHALVITGKSADPDAATAQAAASLDSGEPRRKWDEMLLAQGADLAAFNAKLRLDHTAPVVLLLHAAASGFVSRCDARIVGEVVRGLGGGRLTKEAEVDHNVGLDQIAQPGSAIRRGEPLCRIHARTDVEAAQAAKALEAAFQIAPEPPPRAPLIVEVI
jgi:pyrimidine-nucleoside phosphorylase